MFEDPDITLFAYVFVIGSIVVAIIWFLFVAPAERRYHERKLRAVQDQIRRREEMLAGNDPEAADQEELRES